jgi:hypothetical protein
MVKISWIAATASEEKIAICASNVKIFIIVPTAKNPKASLIVIIVQIVKTAHSAQVVWD